MRRKVFKKSYQLKKKKSFLKNRFFKIGVLSLIIFGIFFYFIVFFPFFQIREVQISGNERIEANSIKELVLESIKREVIFLPSASIFLINRTGIRNKILNKNPKIFNVKIKTRFPNSLIINIKEREAIGVWCWQAQCFDIDQTGVIFSFSTQQEKLRIKDKQERNLPFLGELVVIPERLKMFQTIQEQLKQIFQIEIKEFIIVSERRLNIKTAESWNIYFDFEKDFNWQMTKLVSSLEEEISSEERKNLKYIDLRFGDRVFFKLR